MLAKGGDVRVPTVTYHPPGDTAGNLRVGDFLLTDAHPRRIVSRAIRFGARLRRYQPQFRHYTHAALVIKEDGTLAEALVKGVERRPISRYVDADYAIVRVGADRHDEVQVLDFANAVLKDNERYGWATFAGLGMYCLTGAQVCLQRAGTAVCSGFVSDALTRAGFVWPRPPFAMMPADLARFFKVNVATGARG